MDIKDLSKQITEALVDQLEVIDERQSEQRARWFRVEGDTKVEVKEKYKIGGEEMELPVIGVEKPTRLDIDVGVIKLDSDLSLENRGGVMQLIGRMFTGTEKSSKVEIKLKLKQTPPSEGLMALHKRAANEIKEQTLQTDVAEIIKVEVK